MNKTLWIVLAVVCLAAAVLGTVMTVMAIQFMEFGRMLFYGTIAFIGFEIAVLAFLKLRPPKT